MILNVLVVLEFVLELYSHPTFRLYFVILFTSKTPEKQYKMKIDKFYHFINISNIISCRKKSSEKNPEYKWGTNKSADL